MTARVWALLGTLAIFGPLHAESGVLVKRLPSGADPARVVALVKEVLLYREWTVVKSDSSSVHATIDHNQVVANIHIQCVDGTLLYDGSASRTARVSNPAQFQPTVRNAANIPERWLAFLRRDLSDRLVAIQETQ